MQSERVLLIGDPHLKVSRIEDAQEFAQKLVLHVQNNKYDRIIILGDLFDTFAVIRSEILSIWSDTLTTISGIVGQQNLILLVGNHDYAGAKGGTHALFPFRHLATVVDDIDMIQIGGLDTYLMSFKRDNQEFEAICKEMKPGTLLICHQSFNGARFENGFYDPHGANPDAIAHLAKVISGHIHSNQAVGNNIYYPGTPFQQSFGEAGQTKGLAVAEIGAQVNTCIDFIGFIDLDMPKFYVIESGSPIPTPDPRGSYKFIGEGSPQALAEFWRSDTMKQFRASVRRVVDAMVPKREIEHDVFEKIASTEDKLEAFIKSKNWRTQQEVLIGRARTLLAD